MPSKHSASPLFMVRVEGLEPPRREALDPKSSVSTNFTTPAFYLRVRKDISLCQFLRYNYQKL